MTRNRLNDYSPAWSPDGRSIAFVRNREKGFSSFGDVYLMSADGGRKRRLTRAGGNASPVWSPSGRQLLFTRDERLYVMNADGSGKKRLSRGQCTDQSWSSDGQLILFARYDRAGSGIYVVARDGSRQRRLTNGADGWPTWSPDGRAVAFSRGQPLPRDGSGGIWVINIDRSGLRHLTRPRGQDHHLAAFWAP